MRGGLGPPTLSSVEKVANSWEDFNLWDRCITRGLVGSMLPGNLYNKGNQILQAPGYVAIRNENHLINLVSTLPPGQRVRLQVWRERSAVSLEAVVGDWGKAQARFQPRR